MLFNSYQFIFLFLPIALLGYEIVSRAKRRGVVLWLGFVSLVFYGWWQPALLFLLAVSILLNYAAAALISRRIPNSVQANRWLYAAILIDLLLLGYYKYFFPFLNFSSSVLGLSKHWSDVVLPLGISFFTFTQIAFLVDLSRGRAEQQNFPDYLLFVTFFPHLIAGPILHHREMMPQFKRERFHLNLPDLAVGGTWFIFGLAKKVLLADTLAGVVYPAFMKRGTLPADLAWIAAISYALELYFDFSGYSDMALGLARMFSIDFPLNFNSPYKSTSIIEVWQRWHMTLSRYIFMYVHNPIARLIREHRRRQGKGITRKERASISTFVQVVALPLTFTMFLAGVWHGAGLQFMIFGTLHGIYLSINSAWRQFYRRRATRAKTESKVWAWIRDSASHLLTLLGVIVSLVFFRANSASQGWSIVSSMFGLHHAGPNVGSPDLGGVNLHRPVAFIVAGLLIVWCLPNTQEFITRFKPSLQQEAWNKEGIPEILLWKPSPGWAIAVGCLFFFVLVELQQPSTFLYFQF